MQRGPTPNVAEHARLHCSMRPHRLRAASGVHQDAEEVPDFTLQKCSPQLVCEELRFCEVVIPARAQTWMGNTARRELGQPHGVRDVSSARARRNLLAGGRAPKEAE
eukprot:15150575-Alexandrium_andersonii.AAC.1